MSTLSMCPWGGGTSWGRSMRRHCFVGGVFVALRLARREGDKLVYAGKVGTGFSVRTAQSVRERLEPPMRKTPPTAKRLNGPDTIWVEPTVKADIACMDLTDDGMVRHASFKGLKP